MKTKPLCLLTSVCLLASLAGAQTTRVFVYNEGPANCVNFTNVNLNALATNTTTTASNPSTNGYGGYTTNDFPLALVGFTNGVAKWEKRPKVYVALLSQTGSSNVVVVTVLENTLGGIPTWSRQGEGYYEAALTGAFAAGKCVCSAMADAWMGTTEYASLNRKDANTLVLQTWNLGGAGTNSADPNDGGSGEMVVMVLIYP